MTDCASVWGLQSNLPNTAINESAIKERLSTKQEDAQRRKAKGRRRKAEGGKRKAGGGKRKAEGGKRKAEGLQVMAARKDRTNEFRRILPGFDGNPTRQEGADVENSPLTQSIANKKIVLK